MNLKVGDKVIVIAGSNKGKEGTIKKVFLFLSDLVQIVEYYF